MIRTATENQGIKQVDLARAAGTSAGNISYALACKGKISEEKWRLICEYVGVDFDKVMNFQPSQEVQKLIADAAALATELAEPKPREPEVIPVIPAVIFSAAECRIIRALIEAHLAEDIQKNGASFNYLKAVFEIHAKCEHVETAG